MVKGSKNLKKYDYKKIYTTAASFCDAARLMDQANASMRNTPASTFKQPYLAPSVVCWGLAIEIFLKCLIVIEKGNIEYGHEIKSLYSNLSDGSKKYISNKFQELLDNPFHKAISEEINKSIGIKLSYKLEDVLSVINNIFVQYRYIFEENAGSVYCLDAVHRAIRYRIIELKPECDDRQK